ncbi:SAM-dependent methyltransferase, partial [Vibrio cholerae O1]|nr:SAM-dependent methyltransferase [Vibrio cholerae O1]
AEIRKLFNGLELIAPGLVRCVDWLPEGPGPERLNAAQRCIAGAVAVKR